MKEAIFKNKNQIKNTLVNYDQKLPLDTFDLSHFNNNIKQATLFYFQQAKNLYIDQLILKRQFEYNTQQIMKTQNQIQKLKEIYSSHHQYESAQNLQQRKRRKRRNAAQIQRLYKCIAQGCDKSYGSQGTLAQHLKLKHPEIQIPFFRQIGSEKHPDQSKINGSQNVISSENQQQNKGS